MKTAALLSTAYTFPYALVQPLLGALSDTLGKTRVMNVALLIVAVAALISSMVTDFSVLVGMRITAGLVAGGVFPAAMALVGDLVPVGQRQVAIGRLLAIGLTGNLLGDHPSAELVRLLSNETQVTSSTPPTSSIGSWRPADE